LSEEKKSLFGGNSNRLRNVHLSSRKKRTRAEGAIEKGDIDGGDSQKDYFAGMVFNRGEGLQFIFE